MTFSDIYRLCLTIDRQILFGRTSCTSSTTPASRPVFKRFKTATCCSARSTKTVVYRRLWSELLYTAADNKPNIRTADCTELLGSVHHYHDDDDDDDDDVQWLESSLA